MAPRAIAPAKGDPKWFMTAAPVNSGASGVAVVPGCSGDVSVGTSGVVTGGGIEVVQLLVGTGGAGVSSGGGLVSV
ncbi:uncharacterized protein BDV17DRAFT_272641 [Aspergillus undulatus]|uniref:uncharacterized protein n=1 Tax=Aspergillus undulatus TaxID=1810928 RepID=UPI003CCDF819